MKNKFNLPNFPNHSFEMETNIFTGKSKLKQNSIVVEQLVEKGKPFLLKTDEGQELKAFPKNTFPDLATNLEINNQKYRVAKQLQWYEYLVGSLPILLLFVGGAIGGGLGAIATIINYNFFREEDSSQVSKYVKVLGVIILCYLVYFAIAVLLLNQFK
jgi:hypothetical protein